MKAYALTIGNGNYTNLTNDDQLPNAINDAIEIGEKFKNFGYICTCKTDLTTLQMQQEIDNFCDSIQDANAVVFYYAGHGFQFKEENGSSCNYITGVDSQLTDGPSANYTSLKIDYITATIAEKSPKSVKIFIFDACRKIMTRSGDDVKGFAPVSNTPIGSLLAFSTSPEMPSYDNVVGRHSYYTQALLNNIDSDCSVEDCFKKVRAELYKSMKAKQISWEHTSLIGNFKFNCNNRIYSHTPAQISSSGNANIYAKDAFADANFAIAEYSYMEMIRKFKSYNWYTQNEAILAFNKLNRDAVPANVQFVIGRNILQAAVGGENECTSIMNNLNVYLSKWSEPQSNVNHLLNGMLYEMYFDRNGILRQKGAYKSAFKEELLRLRHTEFYANSFAFLAKQLETYSMIYIPGYTLEQLIVNITTEEYIQQENSFNKIVSIQIENKECLNDTEYQNFSIYSPTFNCNEIEHKLLTELCAPKDAIIFHWQNGQVDDIIYTENQQLLK